MQPVQADKSELLRLPGAGAIDAGVGSMTQAPFVICAPQPAGDPRSDEFYLYSGSPDSLVRLHPEQVRRYEAIDDGHPPGVYHLPYVHGWLLDFRRLLGGTTRWIVFARAGKLFLDTGCGVVSITDPEMSVRVRRFGCLVRVRVLAAPARGAHQFWIRIPLMRLILRDPVASVNECEPVCHLFSEMETPAGFEWWRERFSSGITHRSTALKFVRSLES